MQGTDLSDGRGKSLSPTADELAPALARALARVCEVEGIAFAQVRSIQVEDDEISVRIERPDGSGRIVTYPVAVLAEKSPLR